MKVFIVFLGLLVVNIGVLSYQGDMGRYIHGQTLLKAAAEECAAGAALHLDEEAYSNGEIVFDQAEARKYAEAHLAHTISQFASVKVIRADCALFFDDDHEGYSASNTQRLPTVAAKITIDVEDIFSLPFLSVQQVVREAKYELVEF